MSSLRSPKRRKILASINPPDIYPDDEISANPSDRRRDVSASAPRSDTLATHQTAEGVAPKGTADPGAESDITDAPKVTKFRFKSSRSHRSSRHRQHDDDDVSDSRPRHHHRSRSRSRSRSPTSQKHGKYSHRRKRRHHRRRRHSQSPPPLSNPAKEPDPFAPSRLSPDTAFRESLFDAMADDEGAAYWESVYGQPIHVYPSTRTGPQGELERMTDEEYAAYVRQKMWEKTHAGLVEERERKAKEREERKRKEEEGRRIAEEMERSLRRGEQRRRRRGWRGFWEAYLQKWEGWDGQVEGIPWPVREGEGIEEEGLRAFFVNGLALDELGEKEFAAKLKEERVRWHPDKMQQKLGGKVDSEVMKDVTIIFQVIDRLWNDARKASS